jgi:hypothetical protein
MTTPPDRHPDLVQVLLFAGQIPDLATADDYTIADNMLHRANGNHQLAAQYYRAYIATRRPTP